MHPADPTCRPEAQRTLGGIAMALTTKPVRGGAFRPKQFHSCHVPERFEAATVYGYRPLPACLPSPMRMAASNEHGVTLPMS